MTGQFLGKIMEQINNALQYMDFIDHNAWNDTSPSLWGPSFYKVSTYKTEMTMAPL